MGMQKVGNTTTQELDQTLEIQTTDAEDVDSTGAGNETTWQSTDWTKFNSYYKNHVAAKATINKVAMWTMGKGIIADEKTKKILERIIGWGKDTDKKVFDNLLRVKRVNGDSYAEIITTDKELINDDGTNLLNLKPLNPGSMVHVLNDKGMLTGYKQKLSNGKEATYKLEQIFHLTLNRTADEIHGTGDIESLITFLDKIKQLDEDMAVMFHRFVVPLVIWELNTDDPTEMSKFKVQSKKSRNGGDDMVISKGATDWNLMEAGKGVGKIINPMEWRNKWTEEVIKGGGVPALIMAIESGTTEASSKMVYMAWQVVVDDDQTDLIDDIKSQLHLEIQLPEPPKIDQAVNTDESKDAGSQTKVKPNETEATLPGKK